MRWKRGVCVLLLVAIAGGTTAGILCSGVAEAKEPSPQTQAQTKSPRSPNIPQTLAREKADFMLVRMMIRAEELEEGSTIDIETPSRQLVQTLTVNERHEAVTDGLQPGQYLAVSETIGSVLFSLHENASVSVIGGNGWSDGEMVWMSTQQTGTVRVCRYVEKSAVDADDGTWYTYSLQGQDYAADRIIHITLETAQEGAYYVQCCTFSGLAEGSYALWENGTQIRTVEVGAGDVTEINLGA